MPDTIIWDNLIEVERDNLVAAEIMHLPGAYTTDLKDAYAVADEMIRRGCIVSVFRGPEIPATCAIWLASKASVLERQTAGSVPEVISKTALFFVQNKKLPDSE